MIIANADAELAKINAELGFDTKREWLHCLKVNDELEIGLFYVRSRRGPQRGYRPALVLRHPGIIKQYEALTGTEAEPYVSTWLCGLEHRTYMFDPDHSQADRERMAEEAKRYIEKLCGELRNIKGEADSLRFMDADQRGVLTGNESWCFQMLLELNHRDKNNVLAQVNEHATRTDILAVEQRFCNAFLKEYGLSVAV